MSQLQKINEKLVINIENKTYELDVYGSWKEPWLIANQCGEILGLTNIHYNLQRVKAEWKRTLSIPYSSSNNSNTTLIYVKALYRIIMRMNDNPFAEQFQDMVYDMIEEKRLALYNNNNALTIQQQQQHILNINQQGLAILQQLGMLDDRTRVLIQTNIMNVLQPPAIEYNNNTGNEEVSLSKRVLELFGFCLDATNHHSILCRVGKQVRRAYIAYYNRPPIKRNQYVHGTLRSVCHYTRNEWEECLDAVLYDNEQLFRYN